MIGNGVGCYTFDDVVCPSGSGQLVVSVPSSLGTLRFWGSTAVSQWADCMFQRKKVGLIIKKLGN